MKKLLSFVIAVMMAMPIFAANNTMNYQAIITNPDGTPAANREIGMKFSIIADGVTFYTEEYPIMTNDQGLVEHIIGNSSLSGLSNIDWTIPGLYLEVSVDLNGGTNYTTMYHSTIQAVPTAMYAEKSGDTKEVWEYASNLSAYIDNVYQFAERTQGDVYALQENVNRGLNDLNDKIANLEVGSSEEIEKDIKELANELESVRFWALDWFNDLAARIQHNSDSIDTLAREIANLGTGSSGDIDKAELEAKLQYLEASFVDNRALIEELRAKLSEMSTFWVDRSEFTEEMYRIDNTLAAIQDHTNAAIDMIEARLKAELDVLQNQTQAVVAEKIAMMETKLNALVEEQQEQTKNLIAQTVALIDSKVDLEVQDLKNRIEDMAKGLIEDYSGLLQNELAKLKEDMTAYVEAYLKEYLNGYMGDVNNSISDLEMYITKQQADIALTNRRVSDNESRLNVVEGTQTDFHNFMVSNFEEIQVLKQENDDLKNQIADLKDIVNTLQQKVEELSK